MVLCQWNGHHHIHISEKAEHEASCPDMADTVDRLSYFSQLGREKEQKEREMKEKTEMEMKLSGASHDENKNWTMTGSAADVKPGSACWLFTDF